MPLKNSARCYFTKISLTLGTEICFSITILAAPSVLLECYPYLNSFLETVGFQRKWRHLSKLQYMLEACMYCSTEINGSMYKVVST